MKIKKIALLIFLVSLYSCSEEKFSFREKIPVAKNNSYTIKKGESKINDVETFNNESEKINDSTLEFASEISTPAYIKPKSKICFAAETNQKHESNLN